MTEVVKLLKWSQSIGRQMSSGLKLSQAPECSLFPVDKMDCMHVFLRKKQKNPEFIDVLD